MSEQNVTPGNSAFKRNPKPKTIMMIVVLALIAILVFTSLYMVDQSEQAVVLRFGKQHKIADAGLQIKLPFGIDRIIKVPITVEQTMEFGFRTIESGINTRYSKNNFDSESVMLTGDLNIVSVEWSIRYRIVDPASWLFNVNNRDKTIRDVSQSVMNELVGDRAILDVIGDERTSIEIKGKEMMNDILNEYNLGININLLKLQTILPPEGTVRNAFEDVNKAIQDMKGFISEGKQAYNTEIPKASGQARQMIQQAEGYASGRVNRANGDIARFNSVYEEYINNRSVTRSRIYYEMMEEVLSNNSNIDLIDKNLDNFLPLKNLETQNTGGVQ